VQSWYNHIMTAAQSRETLRSGKRKFRTISVKGADGKMHTLKIAIVRKSRGKSNGTK